MIFSCCKVNTILNNVNIITYFFTLLFQLITNITGLKEKTNSQGKINHMSNVKFG